MKKLKTLKKIIQQADSAKKSNPLDLSADQDLSVALINMVAIENSAQNSYPVVCDVVGEMRQKLMKTITKQNKNSEKLEILRDLLGSMWTEMEKAYRMQQSKADRLKAWRHFDLAYELYSLFWGINMNLIDVKYFQEYKNSIINTLD